MIKRIIKLLVLAMLTVQFGGIGNLATAGPGGIGGSSEFTQIANGVKLLDSYAKEALMLEQQIKAYITQLQNLKNNPFSLLGKDIGNIINDISTVIYEVNQFKKGAKDISTRMDQLFKSPDTATLKYNMTHWHDTNIDLLKKSFQVTQDALENQQKTKQAIEDATSNMRESDGGTVAVVQGLGDVMKAMHTEMQSQTVMMAASQRSIATDLAQKSQMSDVYAKRSGAADGGMKGLETGATVSPLVPKNEKINSFDLYKK